MADEPPWGWRHLEEVSGVTSREKEQCNKTKNAHSGTLGVFDVTRAIFNIKKREVTGKEERCSGLPPPPFYKNSCQKCVRAFKTGGARQRAARLSRLNARLIAVSFKITLF